MSVFNFLYQYHAKIDEFSIKHLLYKINEEKVVHCTLIILSLIIIIHIIY